MTTSTPKTKDMNAKLRNSQFRMVSLKLSTQWTIVPGRLHSKLCAWGVNVGPSNCSRSKQCESILKREKIKVTILREF